MFCHHQVFKPSHFLPAAFRRSLKSCLKPKEVTGYLRSFGEDSKVTQTSSELVLSCNEGRIMMLRLIIAKLVP